MDHALAAVRDEVGLVVAPATQRLGPFGGAPQLARLDATVHDCAVDDPGRDRRDVAHRDAHHHLVEQAHAARDVARDQRGLAGGEPTEGEQIRLVDSDGDADDSVGDRECGRRVAAADGSDGVGDEQHALRRDRHVGSQLLDDALRTGHPPASLRDLTSQQQDERRPARAQRRPVAPAGPQVIDIGPLPGPDAFLISPDQVRGNSEHLELVGVEAVSRVGEQRVRLVPRVAGERVQRGLHGTTVDDAACGFSPGWRSPLQHDFDQSRPRTG